MGYNFISRLIGNCGFLLIIVTTCPAWAQVDSLTITDEYSDIPFVDLATALEKKYPVRLFYDQDWVKNLRVSLKADKTPIRKVMKNLLDGTDLHFYITVANQVIITKDHEITTGLADRYFSRTISSDELEQEQEIFEDIRDNASTALSSGSNRLYEIGNKRLANTGTQAVITGFVKDALTGEALVGASAFTKMPSRGVITNENGYYEFNLPKGEHVLYFKSIGTHETRRKVIVYSDGSLDVDLQNEVLSLKEVVITGEKNNSESIQTGMVRLDIEAIKTLPVVLGEPDVMKIVLTLPGVQSVGEGASGFNVRGGGTDQNLILINDAVIYNPNHLFGFFSAFNSDVIKSADLYKSGIQAQYGGRISSVFDVSLRDGNSEKLVLSGGISPINGKITLEGPLKKDTTSFLLGIRSTYSDWLLGLLKDPALSNSAAFFADAIIKVTHRINTRSDLTVSGYHSRDRFRLNQDTVYRYFNTNAAVKWRHTINTKLFSTISGSVTNYTYDLSSSKSPTNAFRLDYEINNITAKASFDWFPNDRHRVKFGISSILYDLDPGSIKRLGSESIIRPVHLDAEKGVESAIFIGDEFAYSSRLSFYAGLRFSRFSLMGPGDVFIYDPNFTKDVNFVIDTISFKKGNGVKSYMGPEYRASMKYNIMDNFSLKLSFDRTRQYIHQLTNTTAISPTDTWRLSNTYLKPQIGTQYSGGLYKDFPKKGVEVSIEGYYKEIKNQLEFKDGADLLLNEVLETDVVNAFGKSYGVEILIRKKPGKLNGWISYTWSRTLIRARSPFKEEELNEGKFFPSNFDKPHNLTAVANYKFTRRVNVSLNGTYSTGRPVTFPVSQYDYGNNTFAYFSGRNQFRIPDFMRFDLAINLEGNHKVDKLAHGSWSFSVYNLTGRNNVYSVFSRTNNGRIEVSTLSVFSKPIPTIIYNFRF